MALLSLVWAAIPPTAYTGMFGAVSLMVVFLICTASFCLAFALFIMAMLGRFNTRAPMRPLGHEEDGFIEALEDEATPETPAETTAEAEPSGKDPKAPPKKPKNGLWQLAAACGMFLPSLVFFNVLESPLGIMRPFTGGSVLQLALLAVQVWLVVWAIRLQRKL